jgi:hypothetical protein
MSISFKAKFGSLDVELVRDEHDEDHYITKLPGGFVLGCYLSEDLDGRLPPRRLWCAHLEHFWYGDSDPKEYGPEPEEAISELAEIVIDLCREFNELSQAINQQPAMTQ